MEPSIVVLDLSVHQNHWWDYTHTGKTDRSTKAHIMFANFINDSLARIYSRQRMRSKEKWWQFDSYEWRHSIWLEQSFVVRVRDCLSQSPLPPPFMEFPLYVLPETCSLILVSIQQASAPPAKKKKKQKHNRFLMESSGWYGHSKHCSPASLTGDASPKANCCWRNYHQQ